MLKVWDKWGQKEDILQTKCTAARYFFLCEILQAKWCLISENLQSSLSLIMWSHGAPISHWPLAGAVTNTAGGTWVKMGNMGGDLWPQQPGGGGFSFVQSRYLDLLQRVLNSERVVVAAVITQSTKKIQIEELRGNIKHAKRSRRLN